MNRHVLRGVYKLMREHWDENHRNAPLFVRDTFRDWMIRLNRRGGFILLDALSEKDLARLLRDEADAALRRSPR